MPGEELENFKNSALRDLNSARILCRSLSSSARRDSPWEMADIKALLLSLSSLIVHFLWSDTRIGWLWCRFLRRIQQLVLAYC